MAKHCKQCGVKHKNNASTCGNCGTAFEDIRVTIVRNTVTLYAILALTAVALIVFGIIITSGPRAKVRQIMRYYKNNDPVSIVNTYPSFILESGNKSNNELIFSISSDVEELSEFIVYFSVDKPQDPNERDRAQILDDIYAEYGDIFDESKLEDIKFVWVKFEGQISGLWGKSITRFIIIKYDGEWCWWPDNFNY